MALIYALLLIIVILLYVNRRELGLFKNRYFIALAGLSIAWWLFLIIDQLRRHLNCTPDDELCNSGNTFWGDVTWGSLLAMASLALVWIPILSAVIIYFYTKKYRNNFNKNK